MCRLVISTRILDFSLLIRPWANRIHVVLKVWLAGVRTRVEVEAVGSANLDNLFLIPDRRIIIGLQYPNRDVPIPYLFADFDTQMNSDYCILNTC